MGANIWDASSSSATTVALTKKETQTATAGQTLFILATFTYLIGGDLQVFINGVRQILGAAEAYEETSISEITFTEGLEVGDKVQFIY
jgi:hypothetical protein